MALQIVPSQNPPPVKRSLILAFVGIPQPNPLRPNGRVFRKLAGHVPAFYLDDSGKIVEMTYEQAFVLRFTRWLPDDAMRGEFSALFEHGVSAVEREARMKTFMQKLQAHKKSCLPPWHTEMTQTAQERAA